MMSAQPIHPTRRFFQSSLVALSVLALLSGCGSSSSSKMGRTVRESGAVLYDDDDAPMKPTVSDYDPLDQLDPDPSSDFYTTPGTKQNQTQTSPVTSAPENVPDATDGARTPPVEVPVDAPVAPAQDPRQQPVKGQSGEPVEEPTYNTPNTSPNTSPNQRPPPSPQQQQPPPAKLPAPVPVRPVPRPNPTTPPAKAPTTPRPKLAIRGFWDEKVKEGPQWTLWTLTALEKYGRALLKAKPQDIESFCPTYGSLAVRERADFWVKLISALAAAESDYRPDTKYTEAFADKQGHKVISRGLLQISIESSQQYGCGFDSVQALHDPQKNLACAVRIMSRWVINDGRLSGSDGDNWLGIGRYWSPFRSDSLKYEKIRALLRKTPVCRQ